MSEPVTLEQLTERMIPSDRLIVEDEAGNLFYKGFGGTDIHTGCFGGLTAWRIKRLTLLLSAEEKTAWRQSFLHMSIKNRWI